MSSNIMMPLVIAMLMYTLFGTFNAQAGGRIDAALSSVIFNGLAAAFSLPSFCGSTSRARRPQWRRACPA